MQKIKDVLITAAWWLMLIAFAATVYVCDHARFTWLVGE